MIFSRLKPVFFIPVVVLTAIGCTERNFSPFEDNAGIYSIYGIFDMDKEIHYIRINNVQTPVLSRDKVHFDGIVIFENLDTGDAATLRDSIVDFSGFITHNFILNEKLQPKQPYRLTVQNPSGSKAVSLVSTPAITEVSIEPNQNVLCHTEPDSIPHETIIEFSFKNVEAPEHVQMEVGFHATNGIKWAKIGLVNQLEYRENQNEMFVMMSLRHLLTEAFPPPEISDPEVNPRNLIPVVKCEDLVSNIVRLRYTHFSREWDIYKPGYFPINPLEWMDVENGLGFLGAFRHDSLTFTLALPED